MAGGRSSLAAIVFVFAAACGPERPQGAEIASTPTVAPPPTEVHSPPPSPPTANAVASGAASASAGPPASAPAPAEPPVPEPERVEVPLEIQAIIDAYDRTPEDRSLDSGRLPGQLLSFFDVQPGMRVAELGAGTGYYSELLARAVGSTGKVYAQNAKPMADKADKAWTARLARKIMQPVVRVDRDYVDPLPPDAKDLDAVFLFGSYHDLYWMNVDRAKMNHAILAALKPGGVFGIVDHAAKPGDGASVVQTLHRIEESTERRDVESAGFVLDSEATFYRNPRDTKDWSTAQSNPGESRGTSDRFVLLFRKPR